MSLLARIVAPYAGVRDLDRRCYAVVATTLLAVAARMSLFTFLGIHFHRDLGIDLRLVGLGLLLENIVRGVIAPVAGALADHVGRRPIMLGSAILTALVMPTFLLVTGPASLVAWSLAVGAAQSGFWPSATALLLDLAPADRRQSVLSLNYTAISIGYTVGVIPAGLLLAYGYGVLAALTFAGFAGIALVIAIALRGPLPETRSASGSLLRDLATAPRDPRFRLFAALACIFPLGIGLLAMVTPIYAADSGHDEGTIGLVLALNGPLLALLAVPVNARIERGGPFRYLALSAFVLGASYLVLAWSGSVLAILLAVSVFTAGELIFSAAVPTAVAAFAPPGLRGAYQGAWNFVFAIGVGAALLLTGIARDAAGWRWAWVIWATIAAIAGAGLLAARGRLRGATA